MYDAYGKPAVLDADFSDDGDGASDVDNVILYAGYRWDTETGLYSVRCRAYHPTLGRWVQRDPVGYLETTNLYQYALSSPAGHIDPFALACTPCYCGGNGPECWIR